MNCPYCGSEMEPGFLQGHELLSWNRTKHRLALRAGAGEVLLADTPSWRFAVPACICKSCKKITIDYTDFGKAGR